MSTDISHHDSGDPGGARLGPIERKEFASQNPGFDEYRNLTERQIPVVILEPQTRR
jgi:hypothetical protein